MAEESKALKSATLASIIKKSPSLEKLREGANRKLKSEPPKVTEFKGEAAERVREMKSEKSLTYQDIEKRFLTNLRRQQRSLKRSVIDYSAAKRLVFDGITTVLKEHKKKPIWDDSNRIVLPKLIRYFIGDPESELELHKGIFLMGEVETGKTFLMKVMMNLVNALNYEPRKFKFASTVQLQFDVMKSQSVAPLEKYTTGIYCFDDLGVETDTMLYGNEIKLFDSIIQIRYDSFQNYGLTTHATSNISREKLNEVYDQQTVSRMNQMFNFVYLGGKPKRIN